MLIASDSIAFQIVLQPSDEPSMNNVRWPQKPNELQPMLPVHPVHKMWKLVLLRRQGGNSGKGEKQRIACIHTYLRPMFLEIRDLQK
jgi:hypothetical protein